MTDVYTDTTQLANIVKAAYDKYLEFDLRSTPLFRDMADKRTVDVDKAGSTVTFHKYSDLATATTPLTETTTPDLVGIPDPTPVTLTLYEHGNVVTKTEKVRLLSFTAIDPAIANIVSYNMKDTLDELVVTELLNGTQVTYSNAGAVDNTGPTNAMTASDVFSSTLIRYAVVKLRSQSVVPIKDNLYACRLHPEVSADLRAETGAAGWRVPHEYTAGTQIWNGEIGTYEGAFFIETPRAFQDTDGASSAKVHRTLFNGRQALAEAVAREPGLVLGPVVDPLERFQPIGWKGLLGWKIFRDEALYRIESGTSIA